ncbi:MAG: ABC transporter substrate-binding protein [Treponema sp.]|jgi:peptide/nickel transport system substrate-binding protein|nr:ABC transporter substrate-binding protein [Treponema sp.]
MNLNLKKPPSGLPLTVLNPGKILVCGFLLVLAACGNRGTAKTPPIDQAPQSVEGRIHIGTPENVGPRPYSEATINHGMGSPWDSLNPYESGTMYGQWIIDKIFDRLAVTSAGGLIIKPRAADSWENADGGKAIIFHLNKNSKWHDGVPATARDWVFTVNLITHPDTLLARGSFFNFLEGTDEKGKALSPGSPKAEALDDYTLKLTLKTITIPENFLITNRYFVALPEHLLKDVKPAELRSVEFWKNPVGSGPCIFEFELVGSQIILKANRDYHLGSPGFGTLISTVMSNRNSVPSFIAGDVDIFGFSNMISADDRQVLEQSGFIVIDALAKTSFSEIALNNKTIPSPDVRLALHYALDKHVLSQMRTQGFGVPTVSSVMPGSEYYNRDLKIERDVEKAKELLKKGGYDGRVYTFATDQGRAEIAAVVQQQWAETGFKVEIFMTDAATMLAGLRDGKFDIGNPGHSATADPLWYLSQISSTSSNYTHPSDTKFDTLAEAIQNELDPENRKKLIWEFQAYVAEQTPWIPLWHQGPQLAISKTVQNIDYNAGQMMSDNTWEWYKP